MGYMKLSFPCGLIIEVKFIGLMMNNRDMDGLVEDGCPIHGHGCKSLMG